MLLIPFSGLFCVATSKQPHAHTQDTGHRTQDTGHRTQDAQADLSVHGVTDGLTDRFMCRHVRRERERERASPCRMTPVAATLSQNNDVILLHHTSQLLWTSPSLSLFSFSLHLIFRQPPPPPPSPFCNNQHIGHTRRRYGIRQITKSIWSRLTNSRKIEGGGGVMVKERNNERQCGRLTFNWIGGGRMRS